MPVQRPPRPLPVLASALAAAGIVLTLASCTGHITPLGPDSTPAAMPTPRHLGSPIILQAMRLQPATATGRCPAGWVAISVTPGVAGPVPVAGPVRVVRKGASASPAPPPPPPPTASIACYRAAGTPVTITSAGISPVFRLPSGPPGHPAPVQYGFTVAVPRGYVAAVTTAIQQAYDSRSAVGISVAGKLWQAPQVARPFPGQQLEIAFLSRHQALQLHRILVPSG
jgi:hypothetical protein